uniref:Putative WW-binding domain-containing protein n=1 Tax=Amphilophus citrinellus TaxID=61819 RepID=A0A3Q0S4W4_AMPCI
MIYALQVCAANFGEFCSIVGQEATEKLLMPKFFDLCSDSLWGIRKACAECFMMVSNSTSPEVRRSKLSPLFISLISDQSRWVRQAAFQSLGRFISTFANPSSTGLHFREDDRTITHTPPNQDGRATPSPEHVSTADSEELHNFDDSHTSVPEEMHDGFTHTNSSDSPTATNNAKNTKEAEQTDENFNSFHYWRSPLPDITQEVLDCLQPHMDDPDVQGERMQPECL